MPRHSDYAFILSNVKYKNILSIKDLHIKPAQVTCFTGHSGSGKTTLLRMLNKMTSPDAGEILFFGKDIAQLNSVQLRRKIVMLPQTPIVFPGNIRDNLLKGCEFAELTTPKEQDLAEILKVVHLEKELEDQAHRLSGGEKQRLALARVLLMDSQVLLLDEPSSALDRETEELVFSEVIRYVLNTHKTLIMISHSEDMAYKFSDTVIELVKGQIEKIEELKTHE